MLLVKYVRSSPSLTVHSRRDYFSDHVVILPLIITIVGARQSSPKSLFVHTIE